MKLTEQQQTKALDALNTYLPLTCPACKNQNFQLNDSIFEIREFNGGNIVLGGQSTIFPVIALTCKNCGHTNLFNAVVLGLIEK